MTDRSDLTRWNRAGLAAFEYVDGNAATFLEFLRENLAAAFPTWEQLAGAVAGGEVDHERLLEQYYAERRDLGWEITRTFARSAHVLTAHLNAHANEGYLGTATQWESLRRLVEMLDYHPAPPASASTPIIIEAEEDAAGAVEEGLQIKYTPENGDPPVIFETLQDIDVDVALNALRLEGWDHSVQSIRSVPPDSSIGGRSAIDIQGVGAAYFASLLESVADATEFTLSELAGVDPESGDVDISSTLLWELVIKARLVLDFTWDHEAFVAIAEQTLRGIVDAETSQLAETTSQEETVVEELKARLRQVQIALDESSFAVIRLIDMGEPHSPWSLPEDVEADAGQLAAMVHATEAGEEGIAVRITAIDGVTRALYLREASVQHDTSDWERGDTHLLIGPESTRTARLNGKNVVEFAAAHDFSEGEAIAWEADDGWHFDEVATVDRTAMKVKGVIQPSSNAEVYRAIPLKRVGNDVLAMPLVVMAAASRTDGVIDTSFNVDDDTVPVHDEREDEDDELDRYRTVTDVDIKEVLYVPDAAVSVGTISDGVSDAFLFDGDPGDLAADKWVVANDGTALHALRIRDITPLDGGFAVTFYSTALPEDPIAGLDQLEELTGPFSHHIDPDEHNRNGTPVTGRRLQLADGVPDSLVKGRSIILEQETDVEGVFSQAITTSVQTVLADESAIEIDFDLVLTDGFTIGNTIVRGSIVTAGHGEARPQKVLGRGNASLANQSFTLEIEGVSFVADASQPSGVRADIDIEVDARTWTQVVTLNDSSPTDHHFTVRLNEHGHLIIAMGDGAHGRRLPTGSNNVRATFRVGNGLGGNIPGGSLAKPVKPHYLVSSVRQPLDAIGGADLETVDSLRENAPASVLTLSRAVSLADFSALAASQASVWQAAAFHRRDDRRGRSQVEVVVVPAGGGALGDLEDQLATTLTEHALPEVEVNITNYQASTLDVDVTVQVNSEAFDPDEVVAAVRSALFEAFALEHRKLGQDLFLSDVVGVVEAVTGVENSQSVIDGDASKQHRPACDGCVIVIDPDESVVEVQAEEFQL